MKINILGQEYDLLLVSEDNSPKLKSMGASGIAELYDKKLLINKKDAMGDETTYDNLQGYMDKVVRHEIIHAFFFESGLVDYCNNEELVDYLAIQLPKIIEVFKQFEKNKEKFYAEVIF